MLMCSIAMQVVSCPLAAAQDQNREENHEESREDREHGRRLRNDFRKEQWRRNFNVESYLKEQDKNRDGVLTPEEVEGKRTKQFLNNLGIPTNNAARIEDLVKSYNKHSEREAERKRKEFEDRLGSNLNSFGAERDQVGVGGFGVERKAEGLLTFNESATGLKVSDFAPEVVKTADKLLNTFDRDKNGFLDGAEIARLTWKSPPPESSDLNRDGRLSKLELLKRFQVRQENKQKQREYDYQNDAETGEYQPPKGAKAGRTYGNARGRPSPPLQPEDNPERSGSPKSRRQSGSPKDKSRTYVKYVDRLFKKYDANSDGKLDQSELEKTRLLKKANDSDGDGSISKQEAMALVSGGKSAKAGSVTSARRSSAAGLNGRSSVPQAKGDRSSLASLDTDADGQIQMHEFADVWTAEKLKEFRAKDRNGDGILSSAEWRDGSR